MYVYCVYPTMSKIPKQLPNCLKRAETSVDQIVLDGILSDLSVSVTAGLPYYNTMVIP